MLLPRIPSAWTRPFPPTHTFYETSNPATAISDEDSILESFLNEIPDSESDVTEQQIPLDARVFADLKTAATEIDTYAPKRMPLGTNLLNYWYESRFNYQFLSPIALVIHGVPATQVSVERAFSTVKYMMNDYRTRLTPEHFEKLTLLKLNNSE